MNRNSFFKKILCHALPALLVFVWSCAGTKPLPQPRRVADPSLVEGAARSERWDIAAVGYEAPDEGMDYSKAGLEPVFLVFKNKGDENPRVLLGEVRGVGPDGAEYLVYSLEEATRLVFASETFSVTAANAARTGLLGAVVGAGLGALIGTIGGGDNIWKGAAIGAGVGGAAGTVASVYDAEQKLKKLIRDELRQYAWDEEPLPARYTRVGYLYFPGKVGISRVKLIVRSGPDILSYDISIAQPPAKKEKKK